MVQQTCNVSPWYWNIDFGLDWIFQKWITTHSSAQNIQNCNSVVCRYRGQNFKSCHCRLLKIYKVILTVTTMVDDYLSKWICRNLLIWCLCLCLHSTPLGRAYHYCAALAEMILETIYKFLGTINASFRKISAEITFFILGIIFQKPYM